MNPPPGGGFDEISFKLGRNIEGLESLKETFEKHCVDDDRRHIENVGLLKENNEAIAKLAKSLEARPSVSPDGSFFTKKQLAMFAVLGTSVMVMVGWGVEAGFKWAIAKLLAAKFGG